jgi:DNA mismatch repair protein MutH
MHPLTPLLSPRPARASCYSRHSVWLAFRLASWRQWQGFRSQDLKRDKGWIGMLLELWLGASASKPSRILQRLAWS